MNFQINGFNYCIKSIDDIDTSNVFEFCQIPEFPNYYINGFGNVYSSRRKFFLTHVLNVSNHYFVCLFQDKSQKNRTIHSLIAKTFIPNPNNYKFVSFIDGDKSNLKINNIQWCEKLKFVAN